MSASKKRDSGASPFGRLAGYLFGLTIGEPTEAHSTETADEISNPLHDYDDEAESDAAEPESPTVSAQRRRNTGGAGRRLRLDGAEEKPPAAIDFSGKHAADCRGLSTAASLWSADALALVADTTRASPATNGVHSKKTRATSSKPGTPEGSIPHKERKMQMTAQRFQERELKEAQLHTILPITAVRSFIEGPTRCIALIRNNDRCSTDNGLARHEPIHEAVDAFQNVSGRDPRTDWESIHEGLEQLIGMLFCKRHHWKKAMTLLMALNIRMAAWESVRDMMEADAVWEKNNLVQVGIWLSRIRKECDGGMADLRLILGIEGARGNSPETSPRERRIFRRYVSESMDNQTVQESIMKVLKTPLKSREEEPGHIYIYQSPTAPGYVKIGATEGDGPQGRLDGWNAQCKHAVVEYRSQVSNERKAVPHAYRVEALVQAELREYRYREQKCLGCGKNHKEWFNVSPEVAEKVVEKYSRWMEKHQPYRLEPPDDWYRLDVGRLGDLGDLCNPIPVPPPSDPEHQEECHEAPLIVSPQAG